MNGKTNELLFSISLIVSGGASLLIVFSRMLEWPLPDIVIRILGVIGLIALPVLVFTGVRKFLVKK